MRLKKGSKAEVLCRKEVSTGSWLCGEIISGNGHTYNVKYGWFPLTGEESVARVPRKAIRPCPPPLGGANNWVPGDLVEVFHNMSWKTATTVKAIDANNFLVRLFGSSQEIEANKTRLRVRQSFKDGKWLVVGKGSENCMISAGKRCTDTRIKLNVRDDCFSVKKNIETQNPNIVFPRKRKRGSLGLSQVQVHGVAAQKVRVIAEDGNGQRRFPGHLSLDFDEVDAFDTDCCASSVGSCSPSSMDVYNFPNCIKKLKDTESCCSDAVSSTGREYEDESSSFPKNEEMVAEGHRSELHAYRCIIEALYASGPLSWEEEENVTNLRHSLNISNDEHLTQIRNLISANTRPILC